MLKYFKAVNRIYIFLRRNHQLINTKNDFHSRKKKIFYLTTVVY